jgi:hypothetical protein
MKMSIEHWWNDTDWERPKYCEKTCPGATLYTTNLTWIGPGSNLYRLEEKRSLEE